MSDKIRVSASSIELEVTIRLTEMEARCLLKMSQYGSEPYIKWFKENLSENELKGIEPGIKSLFNKLRSELPPHLNQVGKARELLSEINK